MLAAALFPLPRPAEKKAPAGGKNRRRRPPVTGL
jgi:hypothetical protein